MVTSGFFVDVIKYEGFVEVRFYERKLRLFLDSRGVESKVFIFKDSKGRRDSREREW